MRLVEKLVPRSYHLLDYDWTPLSQNPYWIAVLLTASIVTWRDTGVCRQASEQSAVVQILPGTRISFPGSGGDTSFADDLVASRYCKCWEWACLTIRWDFTWVLMMCQAKKNKTPQKERCMFFCLKIVLHSVSGKRTQRKFHTRFDLGRTQWCPLPTHYYLENNSMWRKSAPNQLSLVEMA